MLVASEVDGQCALCPTNWRFKYSYYTALEYGKYDTVFLPNIYSAQSENDIPQQIRLKFSNQKVDFLYMDDEIAIFQDVDQDSVTHLLIFPVKHIDRLYILHSPELLKNIMCAANMVIELAKLPEAYMSISTKIGNTDYIPHFHMHIQSRDAIDYQGLKNLLYPGFYKDSKYF
jgi:diadenosine tetraphosphate (Ap4A) HIT family hydrolase